MSAGTLARAAVAAALALLLLPEAALAWGPGTHILLGTEVLRSLNLLPPPVAGLLATHPIEFLYGNLAADISMAKKYAPVGRHCHHWHVAREMHDAAAEDSALRAATTGYLCHLAADVVAHNAFVPRMLLVASSTRSLGHSYWEHRMDVAGSPGHLSVARAVVTGFDHSGPDELFDRVLSRTLFSFRTNRRIFRGLIRISDYDRWQTIFDNVVDRSRWELESSARTAYLAASFDRMLQTLRTRRPDRRRLGDPIGEAALEEAIHLRRSLLRRETPSDVQRLVELADDHFPLPARGAEGWSRRGATALVAEHALQASRAVLIAPPEAGVADGG